MNGRRDWAERGTRFAWTFAALHHSGFLVVANEPPKWRSGLHRRIRAGILKHFSMGSDGQYNLQFRFEYYKLFNRHTYNIDGCGGNKSQIGGGNFGQIFSVNHHPRTGQFAVRFTF
jgi:hypothetical protein